MRPVNRTYLVTLLVIISLVRNPLLPPSAPENPYQGDDFEELEGEGLHGEGLPG